MGAVAPAQAFAHGWFEGAADTIGDEAESIVNDAKKEAERIINEAKNHANWLTSEAAKQAQAIEHAAHVAAGQIKSTAEEFARQTRMAAQTAAAEVAAAAERAAMEVERVAKETAQTLIMEAEREAQSLVDGANSLAMGIVDDAYAQADEIISQAEILALEAAQAMEKLGTDVWEGLQDFCTLGVEGAPNVCELVVACAEAGISMVGQAQAPEGGVVESVTTVLDSIDGIATSASACQQSVCDATVKLGGAATGLIGSALSTSDASAPAIVAQIVFERFHASLVDVCDTAERCIDNAKVRSAELSASLSGLRGRLEALPARFEQAESEAADVAQTLAATRIADAMEELNAALTTLSGLGGRSAEAQVAVNDLQQFYTLASDLAGADFRDDFATLPPLASLREGHLSDPAGLVDELAVARASIFNLAATIETYHHEIRKATGQDVTGDVATLRAFASDLLRLEDELVLFSAVDGDMDTLLDAGEALEGLLGGVQKTRASIDPLLDAGPLLEILEQPAQFIFGMIPEVQGQQVQALQAIESDISELVALMEFLTGILEGTDLSDPDQAIVALAQAHERLVAAKGTVQSLQYHVISVGSLAHSLATTAENAAAQEVQELIAAAGDFVLRLEDAMAMAAWIEQAVAQITATVAAVEGLGQRRLLSLTEVIGAVHAHLEPLRQVGQHLDEVRVAAREKDAKMWQELEEAVVNDRPQATFLIDSLVPQLLEEQQLVAAVTAAVEELQQSAWGDIQPAIQRVEIHRATAAELRSDLAKISDVATSIREEQSVDGAIDAAGSFAGAVTQAAGVAEFVAEVHGLARLASQAQDPATALEEGCQEDDWTEEEPFPPHYDPSSFDPDALKLAGARKVAQTRHDILAQAGDQVGLSPEQIALSEAHRSVVLEVAHAQMEARLAELDVRPVAPEKAQMMTDEALESLRNIFVIDPKTGAKTSAAKLIEERAAAMPLKGASFEERRAQVAAAFLETDFLAMGSTLRDEKGEARSLVDLYQDVKDHGRSLKVASMHPAPVEPSDSEAAAGALRSYALAQEALARGDQERFETHLESFSTAMAGLQASQMQDTLASNAVWAAVALFTVALFVRPPRRKEVSA